jgi:hypothetical protein
MLEVQDRARAKEKLASGSRRAIVWVPIVALGIATGIFFGRFYFVHELVLFVAIAAILAFFVANLVVLGIVFRAAGRSILRSVRKAKPGITAQEVPKVQRRASPIVVTPPVRPAAGPNTS